MDPITPINVCPARGTEHGQVPFRTPDSSGGMGGGVMRSHIGLGLNDHPLHCGTPYCGTEAAPQEFPGYTFRLLKEKALLDGNALSA